MAQESIHLHYHIEKNGGTSGRKVLEDIYGPEHVFIYYPHSGKLRRSSATIAAGANTSGGLFTLYEQINKKYPRVGSLIYQGLLTYRRTRPPADLINPSDLPDDCYAITGHFNPTNIEPFLGGRVPFRSVVARDPFDRVWSHWNHIQTSGFQGGFRLAIPRDEMLTFPDFAFHQSMTNFQTKAVDNLAVDDFGTVGTLTDLKGYYENILSQTPLPTLVGAVTIPYENRGATHHGAKPENLRQRFTKQNEADYTFYEEIKNRLHR